MEVFSQQLDQESGIRTVKTAIPSYPGKMANSSRKD
jgi:hypothetical protein